MIFAISDAHANYYAMKNRIEQIKYYLDKGDNRLIMLGDYIDRGPASYECLKLAYDVQQEYGDDKVIVLRGNHEEWFLDFLFDVGDEWLAEDDQYITSGTFLSDEQREYLERLYNRDEILLYIKECIKKNHKDLLQWMRKMPYYYETPTQIFVHAGVDEEIPEEEIEYCTLGTPEYVFTGKYPPTTGFFYKDIIAGHVAATSFRCDVRANDIYFDGESHFYIDGSTAKTKRMLCLVYDEKKKNYYELKEDGTMKEIIRNESKL
jgi:serine/threonine protein phosphatase 1